MLEPDHFPVCEISHERNRGKRKKPSGTHTWSHIPCSCFLGNNSKKNLKTFTTFQLGFYFECKFFKQFFTFRAGFRNLPPFYAKLFLGCS